MVVLSCPEEIIGKTVTYVSTSSTAVNLGFTDGTCYSIKLEPTVWNVKEHLKKTEHFANENVLETTDVYFEGGFNN